MRLHGIIRPFILRRLKKDVASQLPGKFEHVVRCELSRRQRFLYEEFMSRSSTRAALSGGSVISMLGVLMQLRKVCNHPDLFTERVIASPLVTPSISITVPSCVSRVLAIRDIISRGKISAEDVSTADAARASCVKAEPVKMEVESVVAATPPEGDSKDAVQKIAGIVRRQPFVAASLDFVLHNLSLIHSESTLGLGAYEARRRAELCASQTLIEEVSSLEERVHERSVLEESTMASGGGATKRTHFPVNPPWLQEQAKLDCGDVGASASATRSRGRGARGSGASFDFHLNRHRIFR
jgi:hypothetical protein